MASFERLDMNTKRQDCAILLYRFVIDMTAAKNRMTMLPIVQNVCYERLCESQNLMIFMSTECVQPKRQSSFITSAIQSAAGTYNAKCYIVPVY
jgi:hypothetical protein